LDLAAYLDRIGFAGTARPDRATLDAIQRLHMLAIPYENIDVQLGRPGTTDPAAAFDKLVTRRRGGWCYEMNGTLGLALAEIGFDVTRVEGAVMRPVWGEASKANHLVLWVKLPEGPVLADVGLGCGPLRPFEIAPSAFAADGFGFSLAAEDDGWWRLTNHPGLNPPSFDFRLAPAVEPALEARCQYLRTDPDSIFVQNLIVQRYTPGGFISLLGRTLSTITPDDRSTRLLGSADELLEVLAGQFGIDEPAAAGLWDKVCAGHEALFGIQA
jgi:N-hydroxyarylamine O-acetyltransferase